MSIAGVIITGSPVLQWEQYTLSLDRMDIKQPRVEHRSMGGYWSTRFSFEDRLITRPFATDMLSNGAMRHVEVFNEKGQLDWEGVIWKVVLKTGVATVEMDLTNVYNRMWARFNVDGDIYRSTVQNDTDSQDKVGKLEKVVTAGEMSLTVADQGILKLLRWNGKAGPALREYRSGVAQGGYSLDVLCLGYWHLFKRRTYNQTASPGTAFASTVIGDIVTATGEFVKSTYIEENSSPIEQEFDTDRDPAGIMRGITGVGDAGSNRWNVGMREDREFYYKQAKRAVR